MIKQYVDMGDNNLPGDCLRACLASVLELDKAQVPHFMVHPDTWYEDMQSWLRLRGLSCLCLPLGLPVYNRALWGMLGDAIVIAGVYIGGDASRRHAVVAQAGKVLHDPIPEPFARTETLDHAFDVLVFATLDPAQTLKHNI